MLGRGLAEAHAPPRLGRGLAGSRLQGAWRRRREASAPGELPAGGSFAARGSGPGWAGWARVPVPTAAEVGSAAPREAPSRGPGRLPP